MSEIKPVTADQMFLAKMAGLDVQPPVPVTVDQIFMQKIIDGGFFLNKDQINALDGLFKSVAYTEDVSAKYRDFCVAFGIHTPDNPPPVVVQDIKMGVIGFDEGKMSLNTQTRFRHRATAIPIGMYLKNGATYKFSIGSLGTKYRYGVQVCVAEEYGLEFPYVNNGELILYNATEMLLNSGWITTDYSYTVERDNCVLCVNFSLLSGENLTEDNYAEILANFRIEEI